MADFITPFAENDYVNRENFNAKILEVNTALETVQDAAAPKVHTHTATDVSYTHASMPGVGDAKGALDALQAGKEGLLWQYAGDLHSIATNAVVSTTGDTVFVK